LRAAAAFAAATACLALASAAVRPATPGAVVTAGAVETAGSASPDLGRRMTNHTTAKARKPTSRMRKGRLILSIALPVGQEPGVS
jgi:hypothetical protein